MQDETMDLMNVSNKIQDVFAFYMLFDFLDAVALARAIYFLVKTISVLSTVHPSNYFWTILFRRPNKCAVGLDGHIILVSTTDTLFCTYTESTGGCSAADQLEVVFTARFSSSSFIDSGKALSVRFGIRGIVELFINISKC